MLKRIHINQHVIRKNSSFNLNEPVITCKTYKENTYHHRLKINGPCEIIYSPDKPLSCGARVWIETTADVEEAYECRAHGDTRHTGEAGS